MPHSNNLEPNNLKLSKKKTKAVLENIAFKKAYTQSHILQNSKFVPLLLTEIFSALSFYLIILTIILPILAKEGQQKYLLLFIYSVAYLLPFLLFSALSGQFAEHFDKARLIRLFKFANIAASLIAVFALLTGFTAFITIVFFLLGVIAALLSPAKNAILPEKFFNRQSPIASILYTPLQSANAGLNIAGFFALISAYIFLNYNFAFHKIFIISLIVLFAIFAWFISCFIGKKNYQTEKLPIDYNLIRASFRQMKLLWHDKTRLFASFILTWFYISALLMLYYIFNLSAETSNNSHLILVFLLVIFCFFSVGFGLAIWFSASRLAFLPMILALIISSLVAFIISHMLYKLPIEFDSASSLWQFINQPFIFHLMVAMAVLALFLPFLYVGAKTALQTTDEANKIGQIFAAHNMQNAFIIMLALIVFAMQYFVAYSFVSLFIAMGVIFLLLAFVFFIAHQSHILCDFAAFLFFNVFRLEYKGMEHLTKAGKNPVLLMPYESMIDGLLALVFCHAVKLSKPLFFIDIKLTNHWYLWPFLKYMHIYALDLNNSQTADAFKKAQVEKKPLVILLDGRIAMTGDLIKNYDNAALLLEKSQAQIIPIKINGLEQSYFAKPYKIPVKQQFFPKVTVTLLEPIILAKNISMDNIDQHKMLGIELYYAINAIIFQTSIKTGTLFEELVLAAQKYGMRKNIIEDMASGKQNYRQLLIRIRLLAKYIVQNSKDEKTVALMLPNNNSTIVTFYAMQSAGMIPAMLNFTLGSSNLKTALKAVNAKTIITSKQFIEKAQLQEVIIRLKAQKIRVFYIENIKQSYSFIDQIAAKFNYKKPSMKGRRAQNHAAILFTSGSEGTPKGVVLTHSNILANVVQIASRLDFIESDKVFNILPMFHSFGLTVATIMPLTNGVPVCFYPSPLHYSEVPEAIYSTKASIIFSTDTFLNGYARNAQAYDLSTIRYCIAGAEPVKSTTREIMMQKFGIRVLEGYGVTEASPVISLNTPNFNKLGTVGKILSGIETHLEKVEAIETGGRLFIKGPNIMAGYLTIEKPNKLIMSQNGWHDTGDIVAIDDEGFLTILGRAKRFAKIGGEMVSLSAVEKLATKLWPEINLAIVAIGDPKKGERLVLICDDTQPNRAELLQFARKNGVAEINIPTKFIKAPLPILGTGKIDYVNLKKLAEENI